MNTIVLCPVPGYDGPAVNRTRTTLATGHLPTIGDWAEPVKMVTDTGRPLAVYVPEALSGAVGGQLLSVLRHVRYSTAGRTAGLKSTSRIFGFQPRLVARGREGCRAAAMASDHPAEHAYLCNTAQSITDMMAGLVAPVVDAQRAALSVVNPDWLMPGGLFTSGIINSSTQLPLHYDAGNVTGTWSAMLTLRRGISGGDLELPEYGVTVPLAHRSLLLFPGADVLHGVTPFRAVRSGACRFTVVYYTQDQLRHCLCAEAELAQGQLRRTEREIGMAAKKAGTDA